MEGDGWKFHENAGALLESTRPFLEQDEAENGYPLWVLESMRADPPAAGLFAERRREGGLAGVAVCRGDSLIAGRGAGTEWGRSWQSSRKRERVSRERSARRRRRRHSPPHGPRGTALMPSCG